MMLRCWPPRFVWWQPISRRSIGRRRAPGCSGSSKPRSDRIGRDKWKGPDVKITSGPWPLFPVLSRLCLLRSRLCRHRRLGAGVLLRLPGLELLEQRFLVGVRRHFSGRRTLLQEIVKPAAGNGLDAVRIKPLLGIWQALPASERGRQRNLFPFRVEGRVLERREFREEGVHEIRKLAVA